MHLHSDEMQDLEGKIKTKDICNLFLCSISVSNLSSKQLSSRGILHSNGDAVIDVERSLMFNIIQASK